jgi:CsoR family transcriptional regulator, copper-sensing transcriptional repressor
MKAMGYSANQADHLARLKRIEGQVRGLQKMIETDQYCIDVLTQIASATKALQSVAVRLLDEHLHHCVSSAVAAGGPEGAAKITEATQAIERLLKS